jgi:hypothetical protein
MAIENIDSIEKTAFDRETGLTLRIGPSQVRQDLDERQARLLISKNPRWVQPYSEERSPILQGEEVVWIANMTGNQYATRKVRHIERLKGKDVCLYTHLTLPTICSV